MKSSRRLKRMEKQHRRTSARSAGLNMVSLMDIFTILVFFLLVTTQNSETLPTPKALELPESTAEKLPKQNIVISVNAKDILVQGVAVADVKSVMKDNQAVIPALMKALHAQAQSAGKNLSEKEITKQGVTIMGDKTIHYGLLKKIMLSCATAKFSNISLAVVHAAGKS